MCGIVGIISSQEVASELLDALIHLQHRGQDAAGMITSDSKFYIHRGKGLVREAFAGISYDDLPGTHGIAHVRYPTRGQKTNDEVQPFWSSAANGVALAHNGNLVNYSELNSYLMTHYRVHMNTRSDSELLLYLFTHALLEEQKNTTKPFVEILKKAMSVIFDKVVGAYSVVVDMLGRGLCAFRDPHGIRPLVIGVRTNDNGNDDYIFASETTMFYQLGFELLDDVKPGELVYVDENRVLHRLPLKPKSFHPCIFEYVYFSRPDAMINDVSVYRSRLRMGQNLANLWQKRFPGVLPDVVIPVPFSSNTAALSFATTLGVRYTEGLYKNPFIGRTFIMPTKHKRTQSIRYKLSPQETEIRDKNVLLIDDSIVRGTTSKEIIAMVREYGAKKVYFASACPEVKNPCYYGIDMPTKEELVAANKSIEDIKAYLQVDELLYQEIDGLTEAIHRKGKYSISKPCKACLDGQYVCGKSIS